MLEIAEPSRLCVFDLLVYGALVILLCELYDSGVWGEGGCDVGLPGPRRGEVLLDFSLVCSVEARSWPPSSFCGGVCDCCRPLPLAVGFAKPLASVPVWRCSSIALAFDVGSVFEVHFLILLAPVAAHGPWAFSS